MSMGLTNAGQTFQRFMNSLFQDLSFVFVYIDGIIIFSSSIEEHPAHLWQVFERLQRNGLIINAAKCLSGQNRLRFLGHIVSDKGIAPVACKVDPINSFSTPQNAQSLRRFLGMVNFYRKFILQCAKILAPLNSLLQGIPAGRNANLSWNEEASTAFEDIKVALSNATLLNYPQQDSPTALFVDASDKFCGAVLSQIDSSGSHRPLEYFSAAFSDAQKRYSTFDKELLAAYLAVHHFTYFLEGRPFTLYTDHKPLVGSISRKKTPLSNRQARYLSFISEFTTDVRHIEGKNNVVADCLSRPEITAALSPSFTDYTKLVLARRDDPSIRELSQSMTSLKLCERAISNSGLLLGDTNTRKFRPIISNSLRTTIFERIHNLSHPGIKATQKLIGEQFVWPNMRQDIAEKCRTCISCQQTKITRHQVTPLQHFRTPDARFSHVHVDIVGPLPDSSGYKYLLTVVDRFTRWPEAIPMKDITAQSCADSFLLHWVACFGSPTIITTDRGAQFTSLLWTEMCQFLGSKLCHTTAFHPAANELNERFNRSLKVALKCQSSPDLWYGVACCTIFHVISGDSPDCFNFQTALDSSVELIFLLSLKDWLWLLYRSLNDVSQLP